MLKKIISAFLTFNLIAFPVFAADQWDKTMPAGTTNISDIDAVMGVNNAALDRLVYGYRVNAEVTASTTNAIIVLPGELAIPNSGGTVVRWRRNTSGVTANWSDIDTGAESSGAVTQYYVYAVADTDVTTFTVKISLSSSSPSGATYYRKIGYFTNNAANDIVSVGNIAGGDVVNQIQASGVTNTTTTSSSYADMDDMVIYFVSSGRPAELTFNAPIEGTDTSRVYFTFDVDGTDYGERSFYPSGGNGGNTWAYSDLHHNLSLSSGTHTIKVQWKSGGSTTYQDGASASSTRPHGPRKLTVREL